MATLVASAEGYTDGQVVNTTTVGTDSPFSTMTVAGTATLTASATNPIKGTKSFLFTPDTTTGANGCYFRWNMTDSHQSVARFYTVLTGFPSAACQFSRFLNSTTGIQAALLLSTTGNLVLLNSAQSTVYTGASLALNTLYRVEYSVSNGTGSTDTATLQVYAGDSTSPIAANSTTISGNFGTGLINRFDLGKLSTATMLPFKVDDIAVADSTTALFGPTTGGVAAPTVTVGADFSRALSAGSVPLTCTATPGSGGTITSYQWTQVSGPTCVITNATSATCTVAPPSAPGDCVFRCTVTQAS